MVRKIIREKILIEAPPEIIWRIITNHEYNVAWLSAFNGRNIALTDWKEAKHFSQIVLKPA